MATVPTMTTFVAGNVLTAAQMNSNVRDLGNYMLNLPMALANRTIAGSVTTSTNTAVALGNEDFDMEAIHSTVSNTSRFTIVTGGYYTAFGQISWTGNTSGQRVVFWRLNGAGTQYYQNTAQTTSGVINLQQISAGIIPVLLVAGDYLELCCWQNTGSGLNLDTASGSVVWVSRGS